MAVATSLAIAAGVAATTKLVSAQMQKNQAKEQNKDLYVNDSKSLSYR